MEALLQFFQETVPIVEGRRLQLFGEWAVGFWVAVGIGSAALLSLFIFLIWACFCFDRTRVITVPKDSELLLPPDEEDGVDVESDKKKRKFFNLETVENNSKLQEDEEDEEEEEDEDEENEDEDEDEEENEDDDDQSENEEDQDDEESGSASRMDNKTDKKSKTDNKKPNKKPNKKTGKKTGKTDKKGSKKKGKKKGSKKSSNDDGDCIITYEHCSASFRTPVFTRAAKQLGLENWTFSSLEQKVSR